MTTYKSNPNESFSVKDLEVIGNYAYIASWEKGLIILDISDPNNPVSPSTLAIPGQSYGTTGLQVVGNYAYVTNINSGLSIIDITDLSNPTLKGSYAGEGWDVQVIGNYAYIANGYSGLQIVNISDPTAPTLVSNFLGSQFYRQRGMEVVGNYAYVASELQGLLIIDISDPAAPILEGTYDTPGEAIRVSLVGNYAYVADSQSGLQIINISNPTNPTLSASYDTPGSVVDVRVIGNYAYIADGYNFLSSVGEGLKIIDVSDFTANPIGTGVISFSDSQFSVNEDGTPVNQVTLTRTEGSTGEVSVTLNLTDGTAWGGGLTPNDYNNTPITVNFADGETSKTVVIPIADDNLIETSETINLTLVYPTNGATIGTQNNAILTIFDNETSTGSLISQNLPVANYTASNIWIGGPIYVEGPEKSFDHDLSTGWNAGSWPTQWIEVDLGKEYALSTIQLLTDQQPEGNTNHEIWVSNQPIAWSGNGVLADTIQGYTTSGKWLRNDFSNTTIGRYVQIKTVASPSWVAWQQIEIYGEPVQTTSSIISFSDSQFSVNEDGTPVNQVTLTRTEGSTGEVSVTLNLTDGTATAGSDYDGTPITVTFADGETSKTVDIPIFNDNLPEINETLNLTLSNPSNGATLGTQTTASLTIIDNDINNATLLNPANFTVNGSAKFGIGIDGVSSILRLTDDYGQSGSAFLTNAINLSNNASFSSYFKFQITDSQGLGDEDGPGADGLVFAIQTIANNVGADGGGIGYAGINQSLGVEFDTFNNGEINGNHVGIDINGDINSVTAQPVADRLNNGNIWSAWVDYNGVSDLLEVRISETNLRPSTAFLSYTVDLPSILTTNDAFIGFTSGTGGGTGDHDILDWQFNNSYSPITEIANSELDFSGVQGLNNWYYGYYDGPFDSSDFQQMTQFNTDGSGGWQVEAGTYWTGIGSATTHGNGTITSGGRTPVEQWAVRRWISEANGTIQIQGHLAKTGMGGNGVIGRIFVDGVEIWSQFIDGYDSTGITYQVEAVVNLNSIVDFALDPSESNDLSDTTIFTAQIKGIESDSSGILSFSSPQFSVSEDGTPITQVTLTRTEGSTGDSNSKFRM